MTQRWTPIPARVVADPVTEEMRRDHARALEELRRYVEALERRVKALE